MPRPSEPEIRRQILNSCADAAIQSGMRDISLVKLSQGVKVSPRMLIYHFGSKEQLLRETTLEAQERLRVKLEAMLQQDKTKDTRKAILNLWRHGTSSDMARYFGAFFNVYAEHLTVKQNDSGFIQASVGGWLSWARDSLSDHRPQLADSEFTLLLGVLRGLFLDYWGTRDHKRTTKALRDFLERFRFENESRR